MSIVTETTNVLPKKESFWKKYKAAWLFWSKQLCCVDGSHLLC